MPLALTPKRRSDGSSRKGAQHSTIDFASCLLVADSFVGLRKKRWKTRLAIIAADPERF